MKMDLVRFQAARGRRFQSMNAMFQGFLHIQRSQERETVVDCSA